jgi:hypothetical protein
MASSLADVDQIGPAMMAGMVSASERMPSARAGAAEAAIVIRVSSGNIRRKPKRVALFMHRASRLNRPICIERQTPAIPATQVRASCVFFFANQFASARFVSTQNYGHFTSGLPSRLWKF